MLKLTDIPLLKKEQALKALEVMLLTRAMDEKMSKLVRQNKGGTFHLSVSGHELVGAVAALSLIPKKDWGLPYYRDRAFAIGLGVSLEDLLGALLARAIPHHSGGRMMPEHFSHKELRIPCQSSCVGSQFLQAVGVAKSARLRGEDEIVYVSAGEGATSQGDFHESLNFSCLHKLPVLFVIQDNGWAISTPVTEQTAGGRIAPIARGYPGLSVFEVDGGDYPQMVSTFRSATQVLREGVGPALVVARVPRLGPHSSSDDPAKYKDASLTAEEKAADPIERFCHWLLATDLADEHLIQQLRAQCSERIEAAALAADAIAFPRKEDAATKVFAPFTVEESPSQAGESVVIMDALNHALVEEMERDPGVIVFGQDVARGKGGVFGITRTLTAKFGDERCFNTPLAESTIIGVATGLSFDGKQRPVAEVQFCDYSWTGMNQLFNELSSIHYRSNGEWSCPVVIRMPYGGYIQGGPYHSQSIEAFLAHCPGLKVVIPSNAADAKRLLKTAIRDPNPVVFLEHKALYRQRAFCARPEPGRDECLSFGVAEVVRSGKDATFVGWGMMIMMAFEIAEKLEREEGISIEIIDPRTLVPFDEETVLTSVKKTGKLLIAHEAARNCGFGAEIAARIAEKAFNWLDAPIVRVTGKDCPVPYCKDLEDAVLPQKQDLEDAMRRLANH